MKHTTHSQPVNYWLKVLTPIAALPVRRPVIGGLLTPIALPALIVTGVIAYNQFKDEEPSA